jgi:hypothetical protein
LDWLRADLVGWRRALEERPEQGRPAVGRTMRHWLRDRAFAGVRAVARLPEAERRDWRRLWEEVEALTRPPEDRQP